jgi:hypothetical protein
MMEAARTSETLVNFYQTTRRYNPEDSNLHKEINLWYWNQLAVFMVTVPNARQAVRGWVWRL